MKFVKHVYYEVKGINGTYGLAKKFDSIEEAIEGGKDMNRTEIGLGYEPMKWIVTKTTWSRECEDDGTFVTENSSTVRLNIDSYL